MSKAHRLNIDFPVFRSKEKGLEFRQVFIKWIAPISFEVNFIRENLHFHLTDGSDSICKRIKSIHNKAYKHRLIEKKMIITHCFDELVHITVDLVITSFIVAVIVLDDA